MWNVWIFIVVPQRCPKQQKLIQQWISSIIIGAPNFFLPLAASYAPAVGLFIFNPVWKKNTCMHGEPRDVSIYFWKRITKYYVREFWSDSNQWSQVVAKFNGPHTIFTIELMCGAIVSQIKHKPNLVLSVQLHIIFTHTWWNRTVLCAACNNILFFRLTVFKIVIIVNIIRRTRITSQ